MAWDWHWASWGRRRAYCSKVVLSKAGRVKLHRVGGCVAPSLLHWGTG